jgi:hypothetical protein
MTIPIIAQAAVNVLSAIFALVGLIHLSGITHLRAVYRLWHYRHHFYRIIGLAEVRFGGSDGGAFPDCARDKNMGHRCGWNDQLYRDRDASSSQAISVVASRHAAAGESRPGFIGAFLVLQLHYI